MEMSRVVDEPDDEDDVMPTPRRPVGKEGNNGKAKEKEDTWFGDLDTICAYQTYKIVRIRDRHLGLLYWFLVTLVIMYITIIIFLMEGRHAERDSGVGTTLMRVKGKAFANGKVFDEADLRVPAVEPSGAFIVTKRVIMKGQTIGRCVDQDAPRSCPCREGEQCVNDQCEASIWCPSLGDKNAADPPEGAVVERMEGLEQAMLQISAGITFPRIGNRMYIAGESPLGTDRWKNITLGELISLAEPPMNFDDAIDKGALIGVSFSWACEVTSDCEPSVGIKYLDDGQGYVQKRKKFRGLVNGKETRDALYMYGIRILVDSTGTGRRTSPVLIVIQVGSCLALLRFASILTDQFMLSWGPVDRRKAYYRCKVIATQDYSDLQDRINLVQQQGGEPPVLIGMQQGKNGAVGGGGTNVHLGLGAGARGGLASTLVRGRSNGASSSAAY